jgi:hypothetical protein
MDQTSPGHGAIMVGGFLGTLITLEKIIPLRKNILYLIPLVSGGSVAFFFAGMPAHSLASLSTASAGLSTVFLIYWIRDKSLVYLLMLIGAICWLVGNISLIKTNFYPVAIPWWMAFVLFVITAERLELMKFLPVSRNQKFVFVGSLMLFVLGCAISFHGMGSYFAALALASASLWLMRYDVVGINLRKEKLTRYVGIALLSAYFALLLSGIFILILTDQPFGYDIVVHSFFIGFVFSMIFAHGPIILPGVLGVSTKPYHPVLYFWLLVLHGSWIARVVADTALNMEVKKYSGIASAVAIVGYFLSIVIITIRNRRAKVF